MNPESIALQNQLVESWHTLLKSSQRMDKKAIEEHQKNIYAMAVFICCEANQEQEIYGVDEFGHIVVDNGLIKTKKFKYQEEQGK